MVHVICLYVCVHRGVAVTKGGFLPSRGLSASAPAPHHPAPDACPGPDGGAATGDDLFRTLHDIFGDYNIFFSFSFSLRPSPRFVAFLAFPWLLSCILALFLHGLLR